MNINKAILELEKLRKKYDGNIELYFDCPKCNIAFTPNFVSAAPIINVKAKKD